MKLSTPAPRGASHPARLAPAIAALEAPSRQATDRILQWLLDRQHEDGSWCAELEGDSILQSETLLLLAFLEEDSSPLSSVPLARKIARTLCRQQREDGGWGQYPGSPLDISATVKAYFALKLVGDSPDAPHMRKAREAILAHGGADAVNSFTRFYLALLGQIDYRHCPAVPPEATLLPAWLPISMYRISAWSRTIFVPLSIVWALRPVRRLASERGIQELFLKPPEKWPPLKNPGAKASRGFFTWERLFHAVDGCLKRLERWGVRPLRRRSLAVAERWMLERFAGSDGLGAIYPPIVWSIVALRALGYSDNSPEARYCRHQLLDLAIEENDEVRFEPCKSPVWDTALTIRALAAAEETIDSPAQRKAVAWLLKKEVVCSGDWSKTVRAAPGGWCFEYHNEFYPDVDDTVMALMALCEAFRLDGGPDALTVFWQTGTAAQAREQAAFLDQALAATRRGIAWVLAMQNRDGGWGAFDKDNDAEFLCQAPFADHNAMIDPSTPDLAGRVLESLARCGFMTGHSAVDRAVAYVRRSQEPDGSWFGRWGVNYIYGTWQCLLGLTAVGAGADDPAVRRGAEWLLAHQQPCGGWGESADSYLNPDKRGQGPPTASQTAWAVWGLVAAGLAAHPATLRGVKWLIERQQKDGSWEETEFTGTGFPQVFYLRYHYYRIYFPLLALANWRRAAFGQAEEMAPAALHR